MTDNITPNLWQCVSKPILIPHGSQKTSTFPDLTRAHFQSLVSCFFAVSIIPAWLMVCLESLSGSMAKNEASEEIYCVIAALTTVWVTPSSDTDLESDSSEAVDASLAG